MFSGFWKAGLPFRRSDAFMSLIRFQILPPIPEGSTEVLLTGNHSTFGHWNPAAGLHLVPEGEWLIGAVEVDEGTLLEFKATRGSWETEEANARGEAPGNRTHLVGTDTTLQWVIADWKDCHSGQIVREQISSRILDSTRDLQIWLPSSYAQNPDRRYPVLCLLDGEKMFDPRTSYASGIDWAADEWVRLLSGRGEMPECLIVAVCQPGTSAEEVAESRRADFSLEHGGADFSRFLTDELIPCIDARYRTLAVPEGRALGGAGFAALNVFHTAFQQRGAFGKFFCLSCSFEDVSGALPRDSAALLALEDTKTLPDSIRIYFDHGTTGLDECYEPYHHELGSLLRAKGWQEEKEFQICRVPGGSHEDISWRMRLGDALRFLFQWEA